MKMTRTQIIDFFSKMSEAYENYAEEAKAMDDRQMYTAVARAYKTAANIVGSEMK